MMILASVALVMSILALGIAMRRKRKQAYPPLIMMIIYTLAFIVYQNFKMH